MESNMDKPFCVEFGTCIPEEILLMWEDLDELDISEESDFKGGDSSACSQKFLVIIAPIEGKQGTRLRQDEINEQKQVFDHFLKTGFGEEQADRMEGNIENVDRFEDIETILKSFASKLGENDLATILFLGHGTKDGELAMAEGTLPPSKDALRAIQEWFHQSKPAWMSDHQCRLVFVQCYSHKVDGKNKPGVVQAVPGKGGIEYIYFTSNLNKFSFDGRVESSDIFTKIHHQVVPSDVYLRPDEMLESLRAALRTQRAELLNKLNKHKQQLGKSDLAFHKKNMTKYLLDGPRCELEGSHNFPGDRILPTEIEDDIKTWRREKLKMFLHIKVEPSSCSVDEYIEEGFDVIDKTVSFRDGFDTEVRSFLSGPAKEVLMPIILVAGEYTKGKLPNEHNLVFQDQVVPLAVIFHQYIPETEPPTPTHIRMLFVGGKKLSGNALTPWFRNIELEENADAVLGDGPKNKIERRPDTHLD